MKCLILIAATVLAISPAHADQTVPITYIGAGGLTCGKWVQDREAKGGTLYTYRQWVTGYLSGAAFAVSIDFLRNTDAAAINQWMENYCRRNPLNTIGDGANDLAQELVNRFVPRKK